MVKCDVFVCFDVYGVFIVVECSVFLGVVCFMREWNGCVGCYEFCWICDV